MNDTVKGVTGNIVSELVENASKAVPVLDAEFVSAETEAVEKMVQRVEAELETGKPTTETDRVSVSDSAHVIEKLSYKIPELSKMESISNLTGNEFQKGNKRLSEQVLDFFNSLGNKVVRSNFGTVILDKFGIKSDIAHGMGRAKAITFAAVPDVIKNGVQIDHQNNWKNRGYDTYLFAAPVKIGEQTGYVGAVVIQNKENNEYYLHEVVDTDGNILKLKKDTALFKTESMTENPASFSNAVSSNNNISQPAENVNTDNAVDELDKVAEQIENDDTPVNKPWIRYPNPDGTITAPTNYDLITPEKTVSSGIAAGATREDAEAAGRLSDILGIRMLFYYNAEENGMMDDGFYDHENEVLYINAASAKPIAQIVAHEITHSIEKTDAYAEIARIIAGVINRDHRNSMYVRREAKKAFYAKRGIELDDAGAYAEVIADYIEKELFTSEQAIKDIVAERRGAGKVILAVVEKMLRKAKKENPEGLYLQKIQRLFKIALDESKARTANKKAEADYRTALENDKYIQDLAAKLRSGEITEEEYLRAYNEYVDSNEELRSLETGDGVQGRQYSFSSSITEDAVDIYTEKQYNNFGWAVASKILYGRMISDFNSKIASIRHGTKFIKSADGYYIIPTGVEESINNVLVYTDAKLLNPTIKKIVKINFEDETNIDFVREEIYDYERLGLPEAAELVESIIPNHIQGIYPSYARIPYEEYRRKQSRVNGRGNNSYTEGELHKDGNDKQNRELFQGKKRDINSNRSYSFSETENYRETNIKHEDELSAS